MMKTKVNNSKISMVLNLKRFFKASLKTKLIAGFVVMAVVMGSVSVVSNIILKTSMNKFGDMLETTLLANDIPAILDGIGGLSGLLTNFQVKKNPEDIKKVYDKIAEAKNSAEQLIGVISQEGGRAKVELLLTQIKTCKENIDKLEKEVRDSNHLEIQGRFLNFLNLNTRLKKKLIIDIR